VSRSRDRFPRRDERKIEPANVAGRVPPHDLDAEAAVLSAVLLSGAALDKVLEFLLPEHFYSDANSKVFEAAIKLVEAHEPVDIVSVGSYLRDREQLAQVGGASYLAQLSDATPAVAHIASHARVVHEKWRLRQLIARCQITAAEGYSDVGVIQTFIEEHEQHVFALAQRGQQTTTVSLNDALKQGFTMITEAHARGDRITGTSTGYDKLDAKTAGLNDGDLIIVAGRPGMGKSAFVGNLAVNVASPRTIRDAGEERIVPGGGVALFSLEMPTVQFAIRMACSEGRVDLGKLRTGYMQPDDWRRLTESASFLSSLPIWIDETPAVSLLHVRAKARRIQAEYNREATATTPERKLKLIIIDYIQLMTGRPDAQSREQEISEISRGLKALAKELGIPIIALAQLNRAVETRSTKDKRPQLSDLRESGSLEQDADMVIFIYRDEYYNPETTNAKGLAELIIAKQRNGSTGKVMTRFTGSCTRFDNLAPGDYPEMDDAA